MKKLMVLLLVLCLGLAPAAQAVVLSGQDIDPAVSAMLPLIDSMILARLELPEDVEFGEGDGAIDDPEQIWIAIYLMAVNWGAVEAEAELTDAEIALPAGIVLQYAQGLFYGMQQLPEIPESMSGSVVYDKTTDAYSFGMSDRGESYTVIESLEQLEDGSLMVIASLYSYADEDGDSILASYSFELRENPAGEDPFPYAIVLMAKG